MSVAGSLDLRDARRLAISSSETSLPASMRSSTAPGPAFGSIWNTWTAVGRSPTASNSERCPSSSTMMAEAPESRMIQSI
ncbi:Uncharacterised protein [Mycobacteroides abscessus subsp. abscessus]|nr:Uncharacterised protein [Mycobacteroides abscessus subsp. abscessus]